MDMTPVGQMKYWIEIAHQEVISLVSSLSDEKFSWKPHPGVTSIAFQVWHLARWADFVQSNLRTNTAELRRRLDPHEEIWFAEQLADAWKVNLTNLGDYETGTGMGENAADFRFPGCAVLLDYLQRCYALEEQAIAAIDEEQFEAHSDQHEATPEDTVGRWLMSHLVHEWEHLGMMKYVCGLYDLKVKDEKTAS
jgi:hypothetical protein